MVAFLSWKTTRQPQTKGVLKVASESEAEKQKDNKDTRMVVIRQRRPSALSCVYSVSAHDICAGETNLSPTRRPWPWYQISWSETHQPADTPPFLSGKKWSHHSPTQASKITNSQPPTEMSFILLYQCFLFPQRVVFYLEMQMEKNPWDERLISMLL